MPNVEKQRERLISLLKELFQLDQPDLDFGFYRIMHAKAGQVTKFLEEDLLGIIRDAFGEADGARVEQAKAAYEAARKQAEEFGAPDPDAAPKVKEAKAAWDVAKDSGSNEGDVYDHLYRFFERYYDNGDFMSRRYFARETDGKAAPYAVPYDGREVYLHWANRDQYYIKTSEYLTNFTFDPTQAKEFRDKHGALFEQKPLKVHCRIVSASEGEHNNVKASEQTERYFIIHEPEPVKIETGDTGEPELVIQFQYRPDPEKTGQEGTWRKKRLGEAADKVKAALPDLEGAGDYVTALMTPAPTEAEKDRALLAKYLAQYTGRNTMDYFIHKDLGGFLRRELDFYIKNEVMRLDDIESADAPRVETYLAKVKVLRRIAQHLIDFLAQLEDFQKRLWLKKKFVVDTQYCITLDRIPEEFYPEIAANEAQREEWIKLFSIKDIPGYSEPLAPDFLKENCLLPIDTAFFPGDFVEGVIGDLEAGDTQQSGVIIHSNNSSALSLMKKKYESTMKAVYIDPPYNTEANSILYKNNYRHASWLSLMRPLLEQSRSLEVPGMGVHAVSIDKAEISNLMKLFFEVFSERDTVPVSVIHNPGGTMGKNFSGSGEFCIFSYDDDKKCIALEERDDSPDVRDFMNTAKGAAGNHLRATGKTCFYPVYVKEGLVTGVGEVEPDDYHPPRNKTLDDGTIAVYPIDNDDEERKWVLGRETVDKHMRELSAKIDTKNGVVRIIRTKNRINFKTVWTDKKYSAKKYGTELLGHLLPETRSMERIYPKSLHLARNIVFASLGDTDNGVVLDYFAGSGTTGHGVIQMNRELGTNHKFVLVEMGTHFDSILKPRLLKAAYSTDWKDGQPLARDSQSKVIKYIRLESYEDALNNLQVRPSPNLTATNADFARDYMLHYWLDFETKGSPSLLNIEWFDDPTAYKLRIKKPGTDEYVEKAVDLVETFNWLIGLHVEHLDRWRGYDAAFKREVDPELPEDMNTRLMLDGALKETDDGAWRFRKVEGYTLRTPGDHNDREKALVVWRKLTGDLEQDNLMLDEWFRKYRLSAQDTEFDVIYVNGSNNLPNLRKDEETWKVRLIEEAFHQAMWDVEG
jgi:adenine-specific DNA-methyltransferase